MNPFGLKVPVAIQRDVPFLIKNASFPLRCVLLCDELNLGLEFLATRHNIVIAVDG